MGKTIPKPVFIRLLVLYGGGGACLFVGVIVSSSIGDMALLVMSVILSVAFIAKGFMLKRKINAGQIYSVSGVCVSLTPKMLGRYKRIELVDTATGDDVFFILPRKVAFKVGHVYTCYFDHPINNLISNNESIGSFNGADLDLPTNGFLGFEDFGIYHEKPVVDKSNEVKEECEHATSNKEEPTHTEA
ncbi:MAG: hypothetical protein FWB87_13815 [Defluviitaleaceae bacterium]|nr:hypothetical protein [Defluviitaleaceae bacterium]